MSRVNQKAIKKLKATRDRLTWQQYKTLRGQVLAGDDEGAMKGLRRLLLRSEQQ